MDVEIEQVENVTELNPDGTEKMEDMEMADEMDDANEMIDWKTVGLYKFAETIRDAWNKEYDYSGWIQDFYGDYVVVRKDKAYWKAPYTIDGDDIDFAGQNEWTKVKLRQEWVDKSFCIKSLGENRVGSYAILWGDETAKDLDGEYFDETTEELDTIFKSLGVLPFMYNHGKNDTIKSEVIGAVDVLKADDEGLWFEAEITNHELYKKYVKKLVGANALFTSTQTFASTKKSNKSTGHIKRWPIAEITGTPHPAEFRMLEVPIEELSKTYSKLDIEEKEVMKLFNPESVKDVDQSQGSEEEKKNEKSAELANRLKLEIRQRQLNLRLNKIGK